MIVGQRIKARLAALQSEMPELSQAEVARRVGMSQSGMVNLIAGRSRTTTYLHKIARELRTTPAYLAGEVDDPDENAPPLPPPPPPRILLEVKLPPTVALERMFSGLLATLDPAMTRDELAQQLAELLPIGLSQLRDLRFVTATPPLPIEASAEADVALATGDRGSRL
ncbi:MULTISPECIES: helix-turn-helix transcriptional regulator [unclassified Sphingomonas]|uniref:helix-turn-helix domain-containing protein n=1 Tax=unclassified Sphingomonas TaxID=196159 RepID=UPI00226AAE32|nr:MULTISPECIES: helix-turn-helix transcriptional regulator [unclassified Sphingomonas]